MDFFQLITVRESCRNYTGEAVPREKLEAILNAARMGALSLQQPTVELRDSG